MKSAKAIDALFTEGKKFSVPPFRIHYLINDLGKGLQFGVGVSTKNFKKAVDRNRVKRLTREAYRLQKIGLNEKVISENKSMQVFFIFNGKELPEYEDVFKKVGQAVKKLIGIIDEARTANT